MTTFILSLDGEPSLNAKGEEYPRRVILDAVAHGDVITTIDADAVTTTQMVDGQPVERIIQSAWCVAREKIDESKFYHIENEGWFAIEGRAK